MKENRVSFILVFILSLSLANLLYLIFKQNQKFLLPNACPCHFSYTVKPLMMDIP